MIEWIIPSILYDELRNCIPSRGFIYQNMLGEWCCLHIIQAPSYGFQRQLLRSPMWELVLQR